MSRRPKSDPSLTYVVRNITFKLAQSTLQHFPEALGFIGEQLDRGIASHVAAEYARLVAKATREGRRGEPNNISHRGMRTSVNAYWNWVETAYWTRVTPVLREFVKVGPYVRDGLRGIRRGSLVPPPAAGQTKLIPQRGWIQTAELDPVTQEVRRDPAPATTWVPCTSWTLHVPLDVKTPAHTDPCEACTPIVLDDQQLELIAATFEATWGHRQLFDVPAECHLFGQPPVSDAAVATSAEALGRVVALIQPSALADTVQALHGSVSRDVETFRARLHEGVPPSVLIVSRSADPVLFDQIMAVVSA